MNIVLLCKSWNHKKVLEILAALRQQDLRVRGIVALAAASEKNKFSDFVRKSLKRRMANYARNEFMSSNGFDPALRHRRNGKLRADKTLRPRTTIAEYAKQRQIEMAVVNDLNSDACVAALKRMDADILLLGGAPIIRANVLAAPKVCALNVHMALLPKFRGMNAAEWSIFCNAPVGVTVHQANSGVDTGAILYREHIDISDCPTIEKMRMKLSKQQHLILAKGTRLLIEKKLTPEPQKKEDGKQYYVMHEKLRKIVEHRLSKGQKL